MARISLEIAKESLHFSAAHFTLFSATERENLHGHNFQVALEVEAELGEDGLAFDYNILKRRLQAICERLDERTLLPERSPHLQLRREGDYLLALFNGERIPFLHRDALPLPVANITLEALADWLGQELLNDGEVAALPIQRLVAKVSSGPGQWARAAFRKAPANASGDAP